MILTHSYFFNYGEFNISKKEKVNCKDNDGLLLHVEGMTCSHCKESVETAVMSCEGVVETMVDLQSGNVEIIGIGFEVDEIKKKIINRGFYNIFLKINITL